MAYRIVNTKTLADVVPGDELHFGAFGPTTVSKVETYLGGWNGRVRVTRIWFATGDWFENLADSHARLVVREEA